MPLSVFTDRARPPGDEEVAAALGAALPRWTVLREFVAASCAPSSEAWGYTGRSTGWGLRLRHGKRVILYLTPGAGTFLASLALGERAVRAVHERGLPEAVRVLVDESPRYAEGRGVRVSVDRDEDVDTVRELVRLKLAY